MTGAVTGLSPADVYNSRMLRLTRTHAAAAAAAIATAATLAACGGSHPPAKSASAPRSGGAAKDFVAQAYKYSACMRSHGVADFPDPKVSHGGQSISIHVVPGSSPAFNSAQRACAQYGPRLGPDGANGANGDDTQAHEQAMLAFARCLRGHGFPRFPDPSTQGRLSLSMITAAGIDLHQPALLHAGFACVGVTHGDITRADVEQAVSGDAGQGTQSSAAASSGDGG